MRDKHILLCLKVKWSKKKKKKIWRNIRLVVHSAKYTVKSTKNGLPLVCSLIPFNQPPPHREFIESACIPHIKEFDSFTQNKVFGWNQYNPSMDHWIWCDEKYPKHISIFAYYLVGAYHQSYNWIYVIQNSVKMVSVRSWVLHNQKSRLLFTVNMKNLKKRKEITK